MEVSATRTLSFCCVFVAAPHGACFRSRGGRLFTVHSRLRVTYAVGQKCITGRSASSINGNICIFNAVNGCGGDGEIVCIYPGSECT